MIWNMVCRKHQSFCKMKSVISIGRDVKVSPSMLVNDACFACWHLLLLTETRIHVAELPAIEACRMTL
jgi:hypothetical protein